MRSLHFETLKHEGPKCEVFIRHKFGGFHDRACHVLEKKHEDGCMQDLQQKKYIDGTRKPKCCKSLFVRPKAFMHATKKGEAFLIYVIPMSNVESLHHDIPFPYKEFKDVFQKETLTLCQSIVHMLLLRREHIDLHLDLFTTCHKTNLQLFVNTLMKILKMVSFNIPNLQPVPLFSLLKKMMVPCHCVLIIMD